MRGDGMTRYAYQANRKERCIKRGKLHEQNRAKAKARKRALQVIFAAAINAKE